MSIITKWFEDNVFIMNADKCHEEDVSITIDDEVIKGSKTVKLMGVTIDNKLHFDDHVSNICNKVRRKLHALASILNLTSKGHLRLILKPLLNPNSAIARKYGCSTAEL